MPCCKKKKALSSASDITIVAAAVMFSMVEGIQLSNQTRSCSVDLLPSAPCNIQWLESLHPMHTTFSILCFQMPLAPCAVCKKKSQFFISIEVSHAHIHATNHSVQVFVWPTPEIKALLCVTCGWPQLCSPGISSLYATVKPVCTTLSEIAQGRNRATEPLTASQCATTSTFSPSASSVIFCSSCEAISDQLGIGKVINDLQTLLMQACCKTSAP